MPAYIFGVDIKVKG